MKSYKSILRDFDAVFGDLNPRPQQKTTENKPWLTMTDEEIDRAYSYVGKADRTKMKKEASTERARAKVREALAAECA